MEICQRHAQMFALCAALVAAGPAMPQEHQPDPILHIELNSISDIGGACRLSFLVESTFSVELENLVVETVVFTKGQEVERLTLFDFQSVPSARPRVRQFDLSDLPCANFGAILINGFETCEGKDIDASQCQDALRLDSRTEIEVLG